ncbi:bifunctional 6-phosphofructo-2-kinase/fructose-2,6-bisphosphate 2-phosphatase [Violaceomyces palustris]|uniref:Bifunctional 6-phosphofructo-2-kinase/fructose-2,6-bisphosphate 2-phosphatase n=1 Tax=Violaceomyces palustris TaxID=1673888 RepID=A0ACD0P315_9BASI|nr:bifunctional 6-phosphofructo-2-kinase/fructose-2,6-bisphosphate 2-phosphatase [Violaceomyces palustris]
MSSPPSNTEPFPTLPPSASDSSCLASSSLPTDNDQQQQQQPPPINPFTHVHHRHPSGGPGAGPGTASPARYSQTRSNNLPSSSASTLSKPSASSAQQASLARSSSLHSKARTFSAGSTSNSPRPFPHSSHHHHLGSRPAPTPPAHQREAFDLAVQSSNLAQSSDGLQALLRDHPELISSSLAAAAGPGFANSAALSATSGGISTRGGSRSNSHGGSRSASVPGTPFNESHDQTATNNNMMEASVSSLQSSRHQGGSSNNKQPHSPSQDTTTGKILRGAPSVGEGGPGSYFGHNAPNRTGVSTPNLGAAGAKPDYSGAKIVVCMVGLPARGKSYVANRVLKYLRWLEYDVKVFNVGQLRRALARSKLKQSGIKEDHTASFFDPSNPAAYKLRSQMAEECLEQLIGWLKRGGNVGIHDATNSTKARRKEIADRIAKEPDLKLVFLESICTDPEVVAANVAVKVSSGDPDYAGMTPEAAKKDFLARISHYEESYEAVNADGTEKHYSYVKITDVGKSVVVNQIQGYLESRIAFYIMNLHLTPRNIFFSRHGESQYNVQGKIGGDSELSERGMAYAKALPKLIQDNIGDAPLTVWHSTLKRTGQTASFLPYPKLAWKSLDELDAGVCDSMTYEEIERYYPEDYANRDEDKFNYRYRGGESYRDVVVRLEPVIMELERQENILIIGHQAIIRALYAYFHALSQEDLPYIKIPLHTVIQLTPKAYGCDEKRFQLPIEAVDTHRPRPQKPDTFVPHPPSPPLDPNEEAATSPPPSQVRLVPSPK